jgi:hypothetical protein
LIEKNINKFAPAPVVVQVQAQMAPKLAQPAMVAQQKEDQKNRFY